MKFPNLYPFYSKFLFITLFLLPVSLAAQVVIWSEDFNSYPDGTISGPTGMRLFLAIVITTTTITTVPIFFGGYSEEPLSSQMQMGSTAVT
jgi:hypothetical protein